jgi:16S rRNA (guanine527-N7)-methyltransferase
LSDRLDEQLERARELGFLGPGPIGPHRAHAEAFLTAIGDRPVERCVDLGSGGGLPGLVLAVHLPASSWTLLDAMQRRTAFLREAVDALELADRVHVVTARAEVAGRDRALRGSADLVVARSFGSPAVTAECAAPLLRGGGSLVVSEPPSAAREGERWPEDAVAELGLEPAVLITGPPSFVRLRLAHPVDERYPRRTGVPGKRPLW